MYVTGAAGLSLNSVIAEKRTEVRSFVRSLLCFTSTKVQILTRRKALSEKRAKLRDAFDKLEERRQMSESRHKLQEERCPLCGTRYMYIHIFYMFIYV